MQLRTFYDLADKNHKRDLVFFSKKLKCQTTPLAVPFLGPITLVNYKQVEINKYARLLLLGSAEANAVTTGLLKLEKDKLMLLPARLHTGSARAVDVAAGGFQAMQIPEVKAEFNKLKDLGRELLLIDLLREGQLTETQAVINYVYNKKPVRVLQRLYHVDDKTTKLGRKIKFFKPNFEGIDFKAVKMLVLSDPIAGGVSHLYALDYWRKKLPNLESVVILAFHLARFGGLGLAEYARETKLKMMLVGFGALLNSNPPEMYFSPTPVNKKSDFVDERQAELMKQIYGKTAEKLCVAGNWTAMFLAPNEGLKWFEKELGEKGLSLEKIKTQLPEVNQLKQMGFKLKELVPLSSFIEAVNKDKLKKLESFLV